MQLNTTTGGLVVLKHDTPFIPPLKGVGFLAQTAGKWQQRMILGGRKNTLNSR